MSPRFSIITPVFNPPIAVLEDTIASVRAQRFSDWEWCIVDDLSTDPHVWERLTKAARSDERIKIARRSENGGISRASNDAIAMASGEFVAFLDHDDILTSDALAAMDRSITAQGPVDFAYSDEAKLHLDGAIRDTFYKPDWSPERMRGQMYTCHFSVMRRTLVNEVGGFRPEFDGSQDYDLVLRVTERTDRIVHVPEVLYLWRVIPGSAAINDDEKPWALDAALRAIQEHCDRVGIDGAVVSVQPGVYRVLRRIDGSPRVSIVIPTRGSGGRVHGETRVQLIHALRSIAERTTYDNYEIVLVADRATPAEVVSEAEAILGSRLHLQWFDRPFNFAEKINRGVVASGGDVVVLLNDDVEVITPDWLETMVAHVQDPTLGMVGVKLIFADETIQHAGHAYSSKSPYHPYRGFHRDFPGMSRMLLVERECSGVTAACCALRREVWDEVGGMSEDFPNNFNDVDFSLRIRSLGYRVLWTPHVELYHFESMTRDPSVQHEEIDLLRARWGQELTTDPYHNPNFDPHRPDMVVWHPAEYWVGSATWR
jgi:glycosyltransferase involved in cell wall biosynthesis